MPPRQKLKYYDDPRKLGQRLRAAREAAGLTQRALSFPGCTVTYISRIETGVRVPSLQVLREFANRIGVSESYLATGRHDRPAQANSIIEARVAARVGEYDEAEELADIALESAQSNADRARVSAVFGEIALHRGDTRKAIDALERARQLDAQIEESDPQVAEALGRAYARALEYESAAAVFARNRDRAVDASDPVNAVRFASLLANAQIDACNFAAAEDALTAAIKLGEQVTDPLTRARMLWSQSRLHAHQGDSGTAAHYAERALEILEVSDQSYYAAVAHQLLAHIELDRGNGERAAELLERGAPLIEASGRKFELASFRIEQARALLALGQPDEAAAIAMEASAAMATMSGVDAGRSYALIADVFNSLDDDERAIELYELAIEHLQATPNRYLVEAYSKLGELLEKRGDHEAALALYKRGMTSQLQARRVLTDR